MLVIKDNLFLQLFFQKDVEILSSFFRLVRRMNITKFKYRYNAHKEETLVLYSVGIHKGVELRAMKDHLEYFGLRTLDLTDNDLAKDHLRHLMGGN